MYEGLKAIHVLSAFGFVLIHGASAAVALRIRRERDPTRVRALLDLSQAAIGPVTWTVVLIMLASGIALGFMASWWSYWWIWAAVALLIVTIAAMTPLGGIPLNEMRVALGIPTRRYPTPQPASNAEVDAILSRWDPRPVTWIGGLGLAAIVLLMVVKPD